MLLFGTGNFLLMTVTVHTGFQGFGPGRHQREDDESGRLQEQHFSHCVR